MCWLELDYLRSWFLVESYLRLKAGSHRNSAQGALAWFDGPTAFGRTELLRLYREVLAYVCFHNVISDICF